MLKLGVSGVNGRMGQEVLALVAIHSDKYVANLLWNSCKDELSINSIDDFSNQVDTKNQYTSQYVNNHQGTFTDVIVDFSHPTNTMHLLGYCLKNSTPLMIGTTGFNQIQLECINMASKSIPILLAPNTSLSVNVLFYLVEQASIRLKDFDAEIIEAHHRNKIDAPSGTALKLGEIIAQSRGALLDEVAKYDRSINKSPRSSQEIGFSVIRGGNIVGSHCAQFIADGELVSLSSDITDRKCFAVGALRAADFLNSQRNTPKLYNMQDVLLHTWE